MEQYSTNLTDKQWQVIEKIICLQERKKKHALRNILNAVPHLLKTGCQWRMIPKDFAPWQSVYYYFCKWKNEGIMEELPDKLRFPARIICGCNKSLGMGMIDSRSVKTSHHADAVRGLDGTKSLKAENDILLSIPKVIRWQYPSMKPIFLTAKVLRKSLKNCPVSFPVFPKFLQMEAIGENLPIGFSTNTDGNLKSFSNLMSVRQSSRSFQNAESWKGLLHGWKILEDRRSTMSFMPLTAEAMLQLAFCKILLNKFSE